jgi:hypothetical protein
MPVYTAEPQWRRHGEPRSSRRAQAGALRALEERAALARKLYHQAKTSGHRLLAETWAEKAEEFEREIEVIRTSTRRMDRLAAEADLNKQSAAE